MPVNFPALYQSFRSGPPEADRMEKNTHLSIIRLAVALQPLRENIHGFVGSQVFDGEAHVFGKQRCCKEKDNNAFRSN